MVSENSPQLVVAMLAGNCENTLDMALESVQDADKIYLIYDSTSADNTHEKLEKWMSTFKKTSFQSIVIAVVLPAFLTMGCIIFWHG